MSGLDALDGDAEPEPSDGELGEIEEGVWAGEGNAIVGSDGAGQAALAEELLEGGDGEVFAGRFEGFAEQEIARGVVGDGQRIAVLAVAELELALEIGAPEFVGGGPDGERGSGSAVTGAADRLDEAVPVEHGMDRALGRNADIAIQPPDQELADLAGAPMRLVALEADDQAFDLGRQLVGIAYRSARAIAERLEAVLFVAVEDLVAGLARDAELPADLGHRVTVQQSGDKSQTLVHYRTLLPGHRHLPPGMPGGRCYPCVRYKTSPMSRAAHRSITNFQ
jgi:hypothetical protein